MTMPAARKQTGMMPTMSMVSREDVPLLMVRYSASRLLAWMEIPLSEPQSQFTQLRKKSSLPPEMLALVESSSR